MQEAWLLCFYYSKVLKYNHLFNSKLIKSIPKSQNSKISKIFYPRGTVSKESNGYSSSLCGPLCLLCEPLCNNYLRANHRETQRSHKEAQRLF
jgi:hypothetical protein